MHRLLGPSKKYRVTDLNAAHGAAHESHDEVTAFDPERDVDDGDACDDGVDARLQPTPDELSEGRRVRRKDDVGYQLISSRWGTKKSMKQVKSSIDTGTKIKPKKKKETKTVNDDVDEQGDIGYQLISSRWDNKKSMKLVKSTIDTGAKAKKKK